jgi:predicted anti-sigma-YlaC factor YlaD
MSCQNLQQRLDQLAQQSQLQVLDPEAREHLANCAQCAAHHALLLALTADEIRAEPPPLSPQLLAAVEKRAMGALRATGRRAVMRWDIAAPLAVSLLALPIALGQGWLWLRGLGFLLESWLPEALVAGLAIAHIASVALTLGALYAALPLAIAFASTRLEAT